VRSAPLSQQVPVGHMRGRRGGIILPVVALVEGCGAGLEAASVELVDQRRDEVRFMVQRRFNLPRERQISLGADTKRVRFAASST
jgi:hypothetical protein